MSPIIQVALPIKRFSFQREFLDRFCRIPPLLRNSVILVETYNFAGRIFTRRIQEITSSLMRMSSSLTLITVQMVSGRSLTDGDSDPPKAQVHDLASRSCFVLSFIKIRKIQNR